MSSLATKEVLVEELTRFNERVKFLDEFIQELEKWSLEEKNRAYGLNNERSLKLSLIDQREKQIKQIEEQEELKAVASKEIPELIGDCEGVVNQLTNDIDTLKKSKPLKVEAKKQKLQELDKLIDMRAQIKTILESIQTRFLNNSSHNEILNDFRQLQEIKKVGKWV